MTEAAHGHPQAVQERSLSHVAAVLLALSSVFVDVDR